MFDNNFGLLGRLSMDDPTMDQAQFPFENWGDFEEDEYRGEELSQYDEYFHCEDTSGLIDVIFSCRNASIGDPNAIWWDRKIIMESELEHVTSLMQIEHDKKCDCGLEIDVDVIESS